jgi:hypothetical protein
MKTYVLIVSRQFNKKHERSGEPTRFREMILSGEKIHTIRANYSLWKKRVEEVQLGEANIAVRYWSGKPYNSKQLRICDITKESGCGIQELFFIGGDINQPTICGDSFPEPSWYKGINLIELAKNDGLTVQDFRSWFKDYKLMEYNRPKSMAIIHFTSFRY